MVVTVSTTAAYKKASTLFKEVRYLPFEGFLPFWVNSPKILVGVEAEYWYLMFLYAKKSGAKTVMVNARMSKKSLRNYYYFRFLYNRIFDLIDHIFCQNRHDRYRLSLFNAHRKTEVVGNLKSIIQITPTTIYNLPKGLNIIAASTHKGEEKLIVKAFLNLSYCDKRLFIVPRDEYRFKRVAKWLHKFCDKEDERYINFSTFEELVRTQKVDKMASIILVDKMGVLNNLYAIGDIAILGGSFITPKFGGHNPLEPAYFGCKVISGHYIKNQIEAFACLDHYEIYHHHHHDKDLHQVIDQVAQSAYPKTTIKHKANITPIIELLSA